MLCTVLHYPLHLLRQAAILFYFQYGRNNSYLNRGMSTPKEKGPLAPMSSVDPKTKEYPRDQLRFHEEIGAGAFAVVYRAEAVGIHRPGVVSTVAVKMLKSESEENVWFKIIYSLSFLNKNCNITTNGYCAVFCKF